MMLMTSLRKLARRSILGVNLTGGVICLVCWGLLGCGVQPKGAPKTAETLLTGTPKIEVDPLTHDFGSMQVGEEKEHKFTIKNVGTGVLKMTAGKPSCKCTHFSIDKLELQPGEVTHAVVRWKPIEESDTFRQAAPIETNDPKIPSAQLNVTGIVRSKIKIRPGLSWDMGEISETQDVVFKGIVFSTIIDSFKIVDLKCDSPKIKTEIKPLPDTTMKAENAKSGYEIYVRGDKAAIPIGQFTHHLSIKTDAGEQYNFMVDLKGRRPGPLRVLAPGFDQQHWALNLHNFPFNKGIKRTVNMFYEGPGELKIENVECDHPQVKAVVKRDEKFQGKGQRVTADFEIQPLPKPEYHTPANAVQVKITTNQPVVGTINLRLLFNAQP